MIKETADKDPHVFIFKIHILSLKLIFQKGANTLFRLTMAIVII